MDEAKREALESAGWKLLDAGDFLGLSEEGRQLVELRVSVARAVRLRREGRGLTQKQLAALLKSSQPRVARIEMAAPDVSLDLMFRGLFAAGGSLADVAAPAAQKEEAPAPRPAKSRGGALRKGADEVGTRGRRIRPARRPGR